MSDALTPTYLPSVDSLDPALLLDLAAGTGSTATIAERYGMTAAQLARLCALPAVRAAVEAKRKHLLKSGYNVEVAAEETLHSVIGEINKRVRAGTISTEHLLDAMTRLMPVTGRSTKPAAEQAPAAAPAGGGIQIIFDQRGIEDARQRGLTIDLPGAVSAPAVEQ